MPFCTQQRGQRRLVPSSVLPARVTALLVEPHPQGGQQPSTSLQTHATPRASASAAKPGGSWGSTSARSPPPRHDCVAGHPLRGQRGREPRRGRLSASCPVRGARRLTRRALGIGAPGQPVLEVDGKSSPFPCRPLAGAPALTTGVGGSSWTGLRRQVGVLLLVRFPPGPGWAGGSATGAQSLGP